MAGFYFKLELEDGTPGDPPILHTAVPNWQAGDTIPLGRDKTLRVIDARPERDLSAILWCDGDRSKRARPSPTARRARCRREHSPPEQDQ